MYSFIICIIPISVTLLGNHRFLVKAGRVPGMGIWDNDTLFVMVTFTVLQDDRVANDNRQITLEYYAQL